MADCGVARDKKNSSTIVCACCLWPWLGRHTTAVFGCFRQNAAPEWSCLSTIALFYKFYVCVLLALKKETSIRFAWEDWNKIYSKSRKRTFDVRQDQHTSTSRTEKLSSAARKVAVLTPAVGQRSSGQENQGRSTVHHARSVQMRARQLNSRTPKAATILKSAHSRRPLVKSVQSRGTQLYSTPIPISSGVRSPCSLQTPNVQQEPSILRRLQSTSLESTSLAWNHFRSPSTLGQTLNPRQPETSVAKAPGNGIDIFISDVLYCLLCPTEEMQSIVMSVCLFDCLSVWVYLSDCISQKPQSWTLQILMCMLSVAMARSSFGDIMICTFGFVDDDDYMISYNGFYGTSYVYSSAVRV